MAAAEQPPKPESFWQRLWRKPRSRWLLGIPLGGFLFFGIGIAAWASFEATLHYTNSYAFCTSCHEMRDSIQPEYEVSLHGKTTSGVHPTCSDCHVPKAFFPKMGAKLAASVHELPTWAMGSLRPKEKFEAARAEMAKSVLAKMRATDSRECRGCHSIESMDLETQDSSAAKKHNAARMKERGETCVDCHQGVGHELPKGFTDSAG